MRISRRSRHFVPAVDALGSRLLLSGASVVITPMDPIPVGYTDGTDEVPPAASGPTTIVVITPMDPVPVGYTDGTDDNPSVNSGSTNGVVLLPGPISQGYVDDDSSNAPVWAAPAAAMGDMVSSASSDSYTSSSDPSISLVSSDPTSNPSSGPVVVSS